MSARAQRPVSTTCCVTDVNRQLVLDFELFREDCEEVTFLWNTYDALFSEHSCSTELLEKSALLFFHSLDRWMAELIIVGVSRLTERASSGSNRNLTFEHFVCELTKAGNRIVHLDPIIEDLRKYSAILLPVRQKIVAHRDLRTARRQAVLAKHTQEIAAEFFSSLNVFTDEIARIIGVEALDYRFASGEGDVQTLLHVLERGVWCIDRHEDDRP